MIFPAIQAGRLFYSVKQITIELLHADFRKKSVDFMPLRLKNSR